MKNELFFYVFLGLIIGYYFAIDWKQNNRVEWSKNMELFVSLIVLVLLLWLLYNKIYNKNNNLCINFIIIFLSGNFIFHFCLQFDKFRK